MWGEKSILNSFYINKLGLVALDCVEEDTDPICRYKGLILTQPKHRDGKVLNIIPSVHKSPQILHTGP